MSPFYFCFVADLFSRASTMKYLQIQIDLKNINQHFYRNKVSPVLFF